MKYYNSHEYIKHLAAHQRPQMRYDGIQDIKLWQNEARAKLMELLGLPFVKCVDLFTITDRHEEDGYTRIDFEFQSEEGYFIPCHLLIPSGQTKPMPGVICLQGHSKGKQISIGVPIFEGDQKSIESGRDFAVRAVKEGCCAIAMDQRYMGVTGHNEAGDPSCISTNDSMAALLLGRTAIGERVWDIMRLIDVIYAHLTQYIDTEKLICMGNSGGGTATFYASCVDERICYSMPSCAVCTFEASIMAMYHCPCNFVPGIRRYFDMGDIGGLIAPRPLVVVCGKEDWIFPLHGAEESFEEIQKIYTLFGKEELCQLVIGNGGHQFYPDEAWPVMNNLLEKHN